MLEEVAWNKSSLLLKIILRSRQTLHSIKSILKQKLFTKVIKNPKQTGLRALEFQLKVPGFERKC